MVTAVHDAERWIGRARERLMENPKGNTSDRLQRI
jgi:hypothetical protein